MTKDAETIAKHNRSCFENSARDAEIISKSLKGIVLVLVFRDFETIARVRLPSRNLQMPHSKARVRNSLGFLVAFEAISTVSDFFAAPLHS